MYHRMPASGANIKTKSHQPDETLVNYVKHKSSLEQRKKSCCGRSYTRKKKTN